MSIGTVALLFVVPAFFIVFQKLHERYQGHAPISPSETNAVSSSFGGEKE